MMKWQPKARAPAAVAVITAFCSLLSLEILGLRQPVWEVLTAFCSLLGSALLPVIKGVIECGVIECALSRFVMPVVERIVGCGLNWFALPVIEGAIE